MDKEILWCNNCKKFTEAEGKLDSQGLSNVCLVCGFPVDVIPYSKVENAVYETILKLLQIKHY